MLDALARAHTVRLCLRPHCQHLLFIVAIVALLLSPLRDAICCKMKLVLLHMRGSLLTHVIVKAVFVVVTFLPHNMQIAIVRLAQSLLLIDHFCTISPSGEGSKNILQERGEQIWQQSERGVQLISSSPVYAKEGLNISAWQQLQGRPKMMMEQFATLLRCCLFGVSKV
jgi:hypothetical protein